MVETSDRKLAEAKSRKWFWPVILVIGIVSTAPLTLAVPLGDVFNSSLRISPDGFDWIIEGRALLSGVNEDWPILRNTNLVLFSALDYLLGETGVVFAIVNSLGLMMQGVALLMILRYTSHSYTKIFFVLVGYYLLPLHFLSLYVLADTIAVGSMMLSAALFVNYLKAPRTKILVLAAGLSLFSGLFQTYGLAPVLVFSVIFCVNTIRSKGRKKMWAGEQVRVLIGVFSVLGAYSLIRSLWLNLIPHENVPSQIELLKLSIDMAPFYLNVWFFIFGPALITLAVGFFSREISIRVLGNRILNDSAVQFVFALSTGLIIFSFLYQWPESRFSYTYLGLFYMFMILLITNTRPHGNHKAVGAIVSLPASLAASLIVFSLIFAPGDYWRPKVSEIAPFRIWAEGLTQNYQPQYLWYSELHSLVCSDSPSLPPKESIIEALEVRGIPDGYGKTIGLFGLSNCL